jgi:hypothetical protein
MTLLLSLIGKTDGLELVWVLMSFLLSLGWLRLPGILHAAGAQTFLNIGDHRIADNEEKHTSLKGGLKKAGDIFTNTSRELPHPLHSNIHP